MLLFYLSCPSLFSAGDSYTQSRKKGTLALFLIAWCSYTKCGALLCEILWCSGRPSLFVFSSFSLLFLLIESTGHATGIRKKKSDIKTINSFDNFYIVT